MHRKLSRPKRKSSIIKRAKRKSCSTKRVKRKSCSTKRVKRKSNSKRRTYRSSNLKNKWHEAYDTVLSQHSKAKKACEALDLSKTEYDSKNQLRTSTISWITEAKNVLGRGQFGEVLEVKTKDGRKLAEKQVSNKDIVKDEMRILCLSKLFTDSHVVGFVDYRLGGDKIYILMEIMEADVGSLKPLQPPIINQFATQISTAIKKINDVGYSHRDVKPDNIMYVKKDGDYTFKLVDFGLATIIPSDPDYRGTPEYKPPEAFMGQEGDSGWGSDAWAFGMTLCEMVSGIHPTQYKGPLPANPLNLWWKLNNIKGSVTTGIFHYLWHETPKQRNQGLSNVIRNKGLVEDDSIEFLEPPLQSHQQLSPRFSTAKPTAPSTVFRRIFHR